MFFKEIVEEIITDETGKKVTKSKTPITLNIWLKNFIFRNQSEER